MNTRVAVNPKAVVKKAESLRSWLVDAQKTITNGAELKAAVSQEVNQRCVFDDGYGGWLDELLTAWFSTTYRAVEAPETKQARLATRQASVDAVLALVKRRDNQIRVEAKVDLLQQIWGNGKPLAECTAAEIVKYGTTESAFMRRVVEIAKKEDPRRLGKNFLSTAMLAAVFHTSGSFNNPKPKKSAA